MRKLRQAVTAREVYGCIRSTRSKRRRSRMDGLTLPPYLLSYKGCSSLASFIYLASFFSSQENLWNERYRKRKNPSIAVHEIVICERFIILILCVFRPFLRVRGGRVCLCANEGEEGKQEEERGKEREG